MGRGVLSAAQTRAAIRTWAVPAVTSLAITGVFAIFTSVRGSGRAYYELAPAAALSVAIGAFTLAGVARHVGLSSLGWTGMGVVTGSALIFGIGAIFSIGLPFAMIGSVSAALLLTRARVRADKVPLLAGMAAGAGIVIIGLALNQPPLVECTARGVRTAFGEEDVVTTTSGPAASAKVGNTIVTCENGLIVQVRKLP